jgi:hypothetical protein
MDKYIGRGVWMIRGKAYNRQGAVQRLSRMLPLASAIDYVNTLAREYELRQVAAGL